MPILSDVRLIRGASPSRHGGIHWYEWRPKDEALIGPSVRDLVLLHPVSRDGAFFDTIAPYLAAGRTVIAPDYPGHGRSDPYRDTPTIRARRSTTSTSPTERIIAIRRASFSSSHWSRRDYAVGCRQAMPTKTWTSTNST